MKYSLPLRLTSAFLTAALCSSLFAMPAAAAQDVSPAQNGTDVRADAALQAEELIKNQLGLDGTLEPLEETDETSPAETYPAEVPAESTPAEEPPAEDAPAEIPAADSEDSAAEAPAQDATEITVDENGNPAMTDKNGNTIAFDPQSGELTGTFNSEYEENLVYNDDDAGKHEGWDYLGTDLNTGASHYSMQITQKEMDAAEQNPDYAAANEKEAAETQAYIDWLDQESLSGDALETAMQQAAEFDAEVLREFYEPVLGGNEGETGQNGSEYTRNDNDLPVLQTDKVSFGAPTLISGKSEIAVQAGENDIGGVDPVYQSATVVIVDNSYILVRVLCKDANEQEVGLNGASVSLVVNGNTATAVTNYLTDKEGAKIDGSDGSAMIPISQLGNFSARADAFVNISCPGYRGITRVREVIEGGSVLTYKMRPAENGQIYLRGAALDGIDVYETNYELFINGQNHSKYDIVAVVEQAGAANCINLPETLELCSGGESKNDYKNGDKKVTVTSKDISNYRMYTYTGEWSNYDKKKPIFTPDKQISLRLHDGVWGSEEAVVNGQKTDTLPLKIDVSLPVVEETKPSKWKFSLSPQSGLKAKIPGDTPFIGGGNISMSALQVLPVYLYYDPDGTILIGVGATADQNDLLKALGKKDPNKDSPSEQEKSKTMKQKIRDSFLEEIEKGEKLINTLRTARANKKPYAIMEKGSVDFYFGLIALIKFDRRTGYYNGDLSLMAMIDGSYTATWYLTYIPVYFGVTVGATGQIVFTVGVSAQDLLDIQTWAGFTDTSGIAMLISLMAEPFLGLGIRGFLGAEVYGNVGIDMLFNFIGATDPPAGSTYPRSRGYLYGNAGWRVYFFFFKLSKNYALGSIRLWDTWNVDDADDTEAEVPAGEVTQALLPDENGNRVVVPALLADPAAREAAADPGNAEYGLYVSQGDANTAEITMNSSDQKAQNHKSDESAVGTATSAEGMSQKILQNIGVSQQMVYTGAYSEGALFRIANVKDNQNYGGKVVPRVTVTRAYDDGLSDTTIALPATRDKDGKVYGYDYSFGVYKEKNNRSYIAIASSCVDPAEHTLQEVAENTRIRLLLLRSNFFTNRDEVYVQASRVLKKPALNGRTDYLFTGTPSVYGDVNTIGFMGNIPGGTIGNYTVACSVTTDLNALTAATKEANGADNQTATETASALENKINDAVYLACNYAAGGADVRKDSMMMFMASENASVTPLDTAVSDLQLVFNETWSQEIRRQPMLAYVERGDQATLCLRPICNLHDELYLQDARRFALGGEIHNLQYANQIVGNVLYCTVDGVLTKLVIELKGDGRGFDSRSARAITIRHTAYPSITDTGENVLLPTSDGLQIVEAEGTLFLVTAYQKSVKMQSGPATYRTDSVLTVYTAYRDNQTNQVHISGPRETVLKDRKVFNATCAITKNNTGYVLRLLYLADQKANIVKAPSGGMRADQYRLGITDDVCNLYMWELHTGVGGQLNWLKPAEFYARKNDGYLFLNAEATNTGAYVANYVTVAVTTDTTNAAGQGDRKDIQVYFTDDGSENGANRHQLGPGGTDTIHIKVPIDESWTGATKLYAAVVNVNGQALTKGFEAVWVDSGQLLDDGSFGLSVKEDGIGGEPYATVRVDNYAAKSFSDVKLLVEVNKHSDAGDKWNQVLSLNVNDNATGFDDKTATLHIPLMSLWADADVYAVRFTLTSARGDVTLNNVYKISDVLLRPELTTAATPTQPVAVQAANADTPTVAERHMLVLTDSSDSSMGRAMVQVTQQNNAGTKKNAALHVERGTSVTFTTLITDNSDAYRVVCWEAYDYSENRWRKITDDFAKDETNTDLTVTAGEPLTTKDEDPTTIGGESEDVLQVRPCFALKDGYSRLLLMALEEVTNEDGTKEYVQNDELSNLVTAAYPSDKVSEVTSLVDGAQSYLVTGGASVSIGAMEFDLDEWEFSGWYNFTYDGLGNVTPGNLATDVAGKDLGTVTPSGGQEACYVAILRKNENPEWHVWLDSNGVALPAQLDVKINDWTDLAGEHKVKLPTNADLEARGLQLDATLLGWSLEDGTTCAVDADGYYPLQQSYLRLYAQWEPKTVDLFFLANDDTYGKVEVVEYAGNTTANAIATQAANSADDADDDSSYYLVCGYKANVTLQAIANQYGKFDHWEMFNWVNGDFEQIGETGQTTLTLQNLDDDTVVTAVFTASGVPTPTPASEPDNTAPTATAAPTAAPTATPQASAQQGGTTPNTGDDAPLALYLLAMLLSGGAILTLYRKKHH